MPPKVKTDKEAIVNTAVEVSIYDSNFAYANLPSACCLSGYSRGGSMRMAQNKAKPNLVK